jgi:hypothetical protein
MIAEQAFAAIEAIIILYIESSFRSASIYISASMIVITISATKKPP